MTGLPGWIALQNVKTKEYAKHPAALDIPDGWVKVNTLQFGRIMVPALDENGDLHNKLMTLKRVRTL